MCAGNGLTTEITINYIFAATLLISLAMLKNTAHLLQLQSALCGA